MAKKYLITLFCDLWSDGDIQNPLSNKKMKSKILNRSSSNVQIFLFYAFMQNCAILTR